MEDKEKEIELLEKLIFELKERLNKLKNKNEGELFLSRQLRSFDDFPNVKCGATWGYVERCLNIYTVNDLIQSYPAQLKQIRNFGDGRLRDLENWMKKYNLCFLGTAKSKKNEEKHTNVIKDRKYYEDIMQRMEEDLKIIRKKLEEDDDYEFIKEEYDEDFYNF
ncbi:MAG: hypothetical protein J6J60_00850 [Clostridia bacterium]|nr:hypothetical protein [Clostridia bacterium]